MFVNISNCVIEVFLFQSNFSAIYLQFSSASLLNARQMRQMLAVIILSNFVMNSSGLYNRKRGKRGRELQILKYLCFHLSLSTRIWSALKCAAQFQLSASRTQTRSALGARRTNREAWRVTTLTGRFRKPAIASPSDFISKCAFGIRIFTGFWIIIFDAIMLPRWNFVQKLLCTCHIFSKTCKRWFFKLVTI